MTHKLDDGAFGKLLSINVKAPMFLTQAALPHLKASGGSVVNISSMGSQECAEGYIGYLVSKGRLKSIYRASSVMSHH